MVEKKAEWLVALKVVKKVCWKVVYLVVVMEQLKAEKKEKWRVEMLVSQMVL
jgi:hypothetical protein